MDWMLAITELLLNYIVLFRTGWNRIFTMSLFVEHMLLGDEVERNLKALVLDHMRGLGQVSAVGTCRHSFFPLFNKFTS